MLLLDASVWIAAADSEDNYHAAARTLVLDLARPIGALDLTLYEIANVVGVIKGQRETATRICRTLLKRSEGKLARVDDVLAEHAIALAAEHGLTAYDAAYVAVACEYAWTLVSVDLKDLVKPGLAVTPDDPKLGLPFASASSTPHVARRAGVGVAHPRRRVRDTPEFSVRGVPPPV